MQARRAVQALALHRATLDRLTLVDQGIPDRRPQTTAQTLRRFGHSSRLPLRLAPGARMAKSPLIGNGPR